MASQLKLVRTYDGTADIDTLDLLNYTDGFDIAYEGWIPKVPAQDESEVIDTLTLRVAGTSHDDLASKLQRIAQFSEYARWYRQNPSERYGVWLRAKLSDESEARQTFVHNIDHAPAASVYSRAVNENYHLNNYIMQLRRVPYWEGTSEEQMQGEGAFTALNQTSRTWSGIDIDSSNQNVYACVNGGDIYKQTAGTGNFTALSQTSRSWFDISIDSSNHNVYACVYAGNIYKQTAGTGNFVTLSQTTRFWYGISIDSSNQNVYACVNGGDIYKQTAGTGNFIALSQTSRAWHGIAVDSSNHNVYACVEDGDIYKQTAGTGNFVALNQVYRDWRDIAVDSSNHNVYACVYYGDIYKRLSGAGDFKAIGQYHRDWRTISVDSSNQTVYAPEYGADIYKTATPTAVGAAYTYAGVAGDVPARITYVGVDGEDTFGIGRFWLGFRSTRFGTPGDFVATYLFKDQDGLSGTAADPLAYGGTAALANFAAGTPDYNAYIRPYDHGVTGVHITGTYLVLLRAKCNTSTTIVRMRMILALSQNSPTASSLPTGTTSYRYYPWVPLSGGTAANGFGYRYYEMGVITVPPFGRLINGAPQSINNLLIMIETYRLSGNASVAYDALVLMPIAEGLVKSSLPEIPGTAADTMINQQAMVVQTPEGMVSAYETDGTYITKVHDVSLTGGVPPGDGIMVFAADNMFGGSPEYKASMLLKRKTRWKELAGSEQ